MISLFLIFASGLSITEWKPIAGAIPPYTDAMWQDELNLYKKSAEFRQLRDEATFSMSDFKKIYFWEWGHRALGRVIGLTYGIPFMYFALRGRLKGKLLLQTGGVLLLGGMQGAIGWWMVKSGLEQDLENPRVNEYRLATHLGSALCIYSSLMWLGLNVATKNKPALAGSLPRYFGPLAVGAVGAVLATAISGALVAGRDAGLIYNDTLIIPAEERAHDLDARVQWRHRLMAVGTATGLVALGLYSRRMNLSKRTVGFATGMVGMTVVQTALGVGTLWSLVKTEVAALHQVGSVLLLTVVLHYAHDVRRILRRLH